MKRPKPKIIITVLVILILISASIGYAYLRSVPKKKPKPQYQYYWELSITTDAPFLNPRNGTRNGGGWVGHVHYLPPCVECDTRKLLKKELPINETGLSSSDYYQDPYNYLKGIGELPSVHWQGPLFTFYAYGTQNRTMQFARFGSVLPLDNTTVVGITEYEMRSIENARLVILDTNSNTLLDQGDRAIFFRDLNSDGTDEIPGYYHFNIFSKDGEVGSGGFDLYYPDGTMWYYYHFDLQKFDNNSSIDHRRSSGWSVSWYEEDVHGNPDVDRQPPLDHVSLNLLGYSYDGYYRLGPKLVSSEAKLSCLDGSKRTYVFGSPQQERMLFDHDGTVTPINSTTVCHLSEYNLGTVTGASLIYIDKDKSGTWTRGDVIWVYRTFDQDNKDSIVWYCLYVGEWLELRIGLY